MPEKPMKAIPICMKKGMTFRGENGRICMQYDLNGKKLKTYPGINMASKVTGTPEAGIMNVLKGPEIFANKFVWAYGILRKMDVAAIRQRVADCSRCGCFRSGKVHQRLVCQNIYTRDQRLTCGVKFAVCIYSYG